MMARQMPVELIQEVLSHIIHDDFSDAATKSASLRSLCLASQIFYEITAPHLYTTIILPDARRAHLFLAACSTAYDGTAKRLRSYVQNVWCGVVSETLYDVPHPLARHILLPARELAWMQADADGRYHGFHYSMTFPIACKRALKDIEGRGEGQNESAECSESAPSVTKLHIVCPDLGRWIFPLFTSLAQRGLLHVAITLYPKGNWDLEASKIERVLRGVLSACVRLKSLQILVGHTPAGLGSRMVRMSRSIPVAQAVRAVNDDRISIKVAEYSFGVYGRSPMDEVMQYTRLQWESRVCGGQGPWPTETLP